MISCLLTLIFFVLFVIIWTAGGFSGAFGNLGFAVRGLPQIWSVIVMYMPSLPWSHTLFPSHRTAHPPAPARMMTRGMMTRGRYGEIPRGGSLHFHQFPAEAILELTCHLPGFATENYVLVHPVGKKSSIDFVKSSLRRPYVLAQHPLTPWTPTTLTPRPMMTRGRYHGITDALEAFRERIDPGAAATRESRKLRETANVQNATKHKKLHLFEMVGSKSLEPTSDVTQGEGRLLVVDVEAKERASGARKLTAYTKCDHPAVQQAHALLVLTVD